MPGYSRVRLWTPEELERASTGQDLALTTLLVNQTTFDAKMYRAYMQAVDNGFTRTYIASFVDSDADDLEFHAPTDFWANWFLAEFYSRGTVDTLIERITTYRDVLEEVTA